MVDDMSTSSQSQAPVTAAAAAYDVSNAADDVLLYKQQQQQQYTISSVSQKFHSYLVSYGRDNVALSSDHDLNRTIVQQQQVLSDPHYGPGMTVTQSSLSDRRGSLGRQSSDGPCITSPSSSSSRRLREFIPEHKKDGEYWMKRQKNNEAAKRSRDKRRSNDVVMTKKIVELTSENRRLRLELEAIRQKYGLLSPDTLVSVNNDVSSGLPPPSPLGVGVTSSDDSTSSSFPLYQPPPPVLDRCYTEPLINQHRPNPEGNSSLPSLIPLTSQHCQSLEGYHGIPVVTGQHLGLHNNINNMNVPRQLFQQSVHPSRNTPDSDETEIAMARHQQPHVTTSTLTTTKVNYLQLEKNFEDPVFDTGDSTQQVFSSSKIRSSSLTEEDRYSPSRSISLASMTNNTGHVQGYCQLPRLVTISNLEIPLPAFSCPSSDVDDDEDDMTRYGHLLASPEVPLNLTTRTLSWQQQQQPNTTKYLLSDLRCGAIMREPDTISLVYDDRSMQASSSYGLTELPCSELWTSNSKHSMEKYMVPNSQTLQQQQQECLGNSRDSDVKNTTPLFQLQSSPSVLNGKMNAEDRSVILDGVTIVSYLSAAARNQTVVHGNACSYDGSGYASISSSELAAADDDDVDVDDNAAQNSSRQVRGGVPLKVWHKRSLQSVAGASGSDHQAKKKRKRQAFQETAEGTTTSAVTGFACDDRGGRPVVDASPDSLPSSESMVNYFSESSDSDTRPSTTTTAATPAQQNISSSNSVSLMRSRTKRLTGLSLTAATLMESENKSLKEKLRCVTREVTDLREMVGWKENYIRSGSSVLAST